VTIRDMLSDYRQRTAIDLLIALNESGQVVARTDMPEPAPIDAEPDSQILKTLNATYNIAIVPADSTGHVRTSVLAASLMDDKFARTLQGVGDEVVIAAEALLGSTVVASTLPLKTHADLEKAVGKDSDPRTVDAAGENYEAVGTVLGAENGPR